MLHQTQLNTDTIKERMAAEQREAEARSHLENLVRGWAADYVGVQAMDLEGGDYIFNDPVWLAAKNFLEPKPSTVEGED